MEALGNRVILLPDPVEKETSSGIILAVDERAEKSQTSSGTVVDFGPAAWLDPAMGGEPWVDIGDKVIYAKYSGKFITNPEDGEEYVVVNDDAIQVRLQRWTR